MKTGRNKIKNIKPRKKIPLPKRTNEINISVSEAEKESISSFAKDIGLKVSDFCYRVVKGKVLYKLMPEHTNMMRLVFNEINNLSQIENKLDYLNLSPSQASLLSDVINRLKETTINYRNGNVGKIICSKMRTHEAKKRKYDSDRRSYRIGISFSEEELMQISAKAKEMDLKVAEYCYLQIVGRTIRISVPSNTSSLRMISMKAEAINDIAKSLNTYLELSDEEVSQLMSIAHYIINTLNTVL